LFLGGREILILLRKSFGWIDLRKIKLTFENMPFATFTIGGESDKKNFSGSGRVMWAAQRNAMFCSNEELPYYARIQT
jgi:hypothetical protein